MSVCMYIVNLLLNSIVKAWACAWIVQIAPFRIKGAQNLQETRHISKEVRASELEAEKKDVYILTYLHLEVVCIDVSVDPGVCLAGWHTVQLPGCVLWQPGLCRNTSRVWRTHAELVKCVQWRKTHTARRRYRAMAVDLHWPPSCAPASPTHP